MTLLGGTTGVAGAAKALRSVVRHELLNVLATPFVLELPGSPILEYW
jgi:hypothetical protein